MRILREFGVCDCHSHVFGPFADFPLSNKRTFDPPEAPIERLESVWESLGMDRTILVQGSAHGSDHGALLAAISRSPKRRRGVALLSPDIEDVTLAEYHRGGIRAVRFNWIHHLRGSDARSQEERLSESATLLKRISAFAWHVEIHIDIDDLDIAARLIVPRGMPVVIDHMARMDLSAHDASAQLDRLLQLLERDLFWVKLSGADRLTVKCEDFKSAINPMRQILEVAADRCIWGLDWPHVNLSRRRTDLELVELLLEVTGGEKMLEQVLIHNPAKLYGFSPEAG